MRTLLLATAITTTAAPALASDGLSTAQLDAAQRVFTGSVDCEFSQKISLTPLEGKPGHFTLGYKKASYTLVPQETTTGAVRLEDRQAGIVWLQIPAKSMLMNARLGQRMVDNCTHPAQREPVARSGGALGVETTTASAR